MLARHGIKNDYTYQNWVLMPLSRTEMENEPSHQNTKAPHFMVISKPVIILHILPVWSNNLSNGVTLNIQ